MTPLALDVWVRPRAGLGRSFESLARGPAAIAYLGLSVTAQREGFRPRLHAALVQDTGHAHAAINAGVGGVGSVSLAFLMDRLVIAHAPVLCFVECTTGDVDGRTAPDDVPRAIEAILRKLDAIECQACLLHLYQREQTWRIEHPILAEYERVAEHYDVPSLHVGRRIEDDVLTGRADVDVLFRDGVHTTHAGAQVSAELIVEGLAAIRRCGKAAEPPVPASARGRCADGAYDRAVMIEAQPEQCTVAAQSGCFRLLFRYVDIDTANAIRFHDPVAALKGLCVIAGPSAGVIRVSTPLGEHDYQIWDQWCTYDRLTTVVFESALPAGTPVTIRPLTPSTRLRVIGFLCLPC
jgi:lysophospholipase L1-like esterase